MKVSMNRLNFARTDATETSVPHTTRLDACSELSEGGTASDGGWEEGGGWEAPRPLRPLRLGVPPEVLLGASDGAGVPIWVPPGVMLTWRRVFSDWMSALEHNGNFANDDLTT